MLKPVTRSPARMAPEDRRRQLIGVGLRMLTERPIQAVSVDAVAAEVGISRGLLFHYFPTKADYYDAVLDAAVRRTLRNTEPDDDAHGRVALHQTVHRFFAQVERRRDSYLALVFGNGALPLGGDRVQSIRRVFAERVLGLLNEPATRLPTVHAWFAYMEDRALQWSGSEPRVGIEREVDLTIAALDALLGLDAVGYKPDARKVARTTG